MEKDKNVSAHRAAVQQQQQQKKKDNHHAVALAMKLLDIAAKGTSSNRLH
jgi:hypothetical protein